MIHFAEDGAELINADTIANENLNELKEGAPALEINFEADGFSVYGLVYTVDFSYEGLEYSLEGGSMIRLPQLVEALQIMDKISGRPLNAADIQKVEFSNPDLMSIRHETISQGYSADDWVFVSLAPFDTQE